VIFAFVVAESGRCQFGSARACDCLREHVKRFPVSPAPR
jgi:hypothetical protein